MYKNRLMYSSLHAADPYFFAKVLFAIDSALQIHWCSCSLTEDRLSVNDSVLHMTEIQYSILWLSFNQLLPKPISDKISNYLENNKDKDGNGKNGPGKNKLKGNGGDGKKQQDQQEVIYNLDKSNIHWRLQEGENFSKVFYNNQKECPKTSSGKTICMKYFIWGLCDSSCNRAHSLSKEDSKNFDGFILACRERNSKPDF